MMKKDNKSLSTLKLWSLFDRTSFAVSRLRELELAQLDLTIEQDSVLYIITNRGGLVTAKELEEISMRQHNSISVLIKGMVRMGLVSKVKSPQEKRTRTVITDAGQDLLRKISIVAVEEAFSVLKEKDRQQLTDYLIKLLTRARNSLGLSNNIENIKIDKEANLDGQILTTRELWSLMDRTKFAISRLRELELSQFGLTIEQSSLLHILANQGGTTTVKEIESQTMRRQHSVSSLIKGMIKMGLVSKVKNPGERQFNIIITKAGQSLFENTAIESLETVFSSLIEKDKKHLAIILDSLLERSRYLLGIPFRPPFLQYLDKSLKSEEK